LQVISRTPLTNTVTVAIVFAPTLNIPAPLIQLFLTDYTAIFGEPVEEHHSPVKEITVSASPQGDGIRSPRHQMFSDLHTPAYNQTGFGQPVPGFQPLPPQNQAVNRNTYSPHPQQYANNGYNMPAIYHLQSNGGESYGSLDAMSQSSSSTNSKKNRRESSMMGVNLGLMNQRQTSRQTLRDTSSSRQGPVYADRDRESPPRERQAAPVPLY
jgi:RalA-binding protein 1